MTVDARGRAAASALLDSTRHDLEAFAMLKEVKDSRSPARFAVRRDVVAALAAVAVSVALIAGWLLFRSTLNVGAAGPRPSSVPSTAPAGTPVVSQIYHYSSVAPAGWTYQAGSRQWKYGADQGATGVRDSLRSPTSPATIFVTSQALPQGVTQTQWLTNFLPGAGVAKPECFPATAARWNQHSLLVDGQPAGTWGGEVGCSFTEVVVFAGNRVYDVSAQPDPSQVTTDIFDQAVLAPFLASMRLTP